MPLCTNTIGARCQAMWQHCVPKGRTKKKKRTLRNKLQRRQALNSCPDVAPTEARKQWIKLRETLKLSRHYFFSLFESTASRPPVLYPRHVRQLAEYNSNDSEILCSSFWENIGDITIRAGRDNRRFGSFCKPTSHALSPRTFPPPFFL